MIDPCLLPAACCLCVCAAVSGRPKSGGEDVVDRAASRMLAHLLPPQMHTHAQLVNQVRQHYSQVAKVTCGGFIMLKAVCHA